MKTPVLPAFLRASAFLSVSTVCCFVGSAAIAQETETVTWPAQITNESTAIRFTSNPYADVQTLTLSDAEKIDLEFRSVEEEATADAPKSESYNSGFKIRFGLDNSDTSASEAE